MVHFTPKCVLLVQTEVISMREENSKKIRTSVILDDNTHDRLLRLAEANDASLAWIIRQAIYSYLSTQVETEDSTIYRK